MTNKTASIRALGPRAAEILPISRHRHHRTKLIARVRDVVPTKFLGPGLEDRHVIDDRGAAFENVKPLVVAAQIRRAQALVGIMSF
jgi:hypothetical protein